MEPHDPHPPVHPSRPDRRRGRHARRLLVGVRKGSSANYNLLAQLDRAGLTIDDVTVKYLEPADALAAFGAGHIDAWAIWDPYTAQAEIQEGARELANGSGVVNGALFQVAANESLEDPATKAAIADYVGRLAESKIWSDTHRDEWARVWAEETGLPFKVTRKAVDRRVFQPVQIDGPLVQSEQDMADTFADAGLLPEQFDVAPYFSDTYNDRIAEIAATGAKG